MYRISSNPAQRRIIIAFEGFLAEHDLVGFEDELKAAALGIRENSPYFDMLVDFRGAAVMPQETAEVSMQRVAWCIEHGLRRAANIVSSTLLRIQLQRLNDETRTRPFTSLEEAVAWLDGD